MFFRLKKEIVFLLNYYPLLGNGDLVILGVLPQPKNELALEEKGLLFKASKSLSIEGGEMVFFFIKWKPCWNAFF